VAVLLAACGGDDGAAGVDGAADASGDAGPADRPAEDVGTAEEADGRVPPLLDVIDGWPETTVTLDGTVTVEAKVADDPARRQQGLMNVPELPDGVGMLFLFDEARTGGFWMKNTLVPLDIAYVLDGEIVAVLQMDPCEADPCPSYDPGTAYDAALEVSQGALDAADVTEGSTVTWSEPVEVREP
jgi:uncharacterized protein